MPGFSPCVICFLYFAITQRLKPDQYHRTSGTAEQVAEKPNAEWLCNRA